MKYEELVAKALEELMDKIKQGFAEESVQMKHVEAMQILQYYSECKYFERCPFGHPCLVDQPWSRDVCEIMLDLVERGVVEFVQK